MLNLIKSNYMEHLVEALCTLVAQGPDNPMEPEIIGIQSRGMKQWLTTSLARRLGICANVNFLFPRQILEEMMSRLPDLSRETALLPLLSRETMAWSLMDILLAKDESPGRNMDQDGPRAYIQDDPSGRKALGLSRRIASVFDDYQVYRPDILAQWAGQARPGEGGGHLPHAHWQAGLWRELIKRGTPFSSRLDTFTTRAARGKIEGLPGRISLFGVSSLPPRFLDAFSAMAGSMEIILFLLTPCAQFFFDLRSKRQTDKEALASGAGPGQDQDNPWDLSDLGNPLLASLGNTGRQFQGLLEDFHYQDFGELFTDPLDVSGPTGLGEDGAHPSMLSVIQSDILNLIHRRPGGYEAPIAVAPGDNSFSVHACHSPMREAQVLKDLLLDAFDRDPGLHPHDVIVMMPDIEAYAPFLEAVFSREPRLPYTVSDRRKRSESLTLEAFLKILDLKTSRLEKSRVLDLLHTPAIGARFGLSMADQEEVAQALDRAGVLWGEDKAHRKVLVGKGFGENTWAFGTDRLMAGYALPEGESHLAGAVLPCDGFEGTDAVTLGNFTHFTQTLFYFLNLLDSPRTLAGWAVCFKSMARAMMAPDPVNEGDLVFLTTALDEMAQEARNGGFEHEIGFDAAREAVEAKLDQTVSQGSFLAGSITFCNLMPMRSIPFELVCLMGMGEQGFPRSVTPAGFDLIHRFPRPGDKQERDEDCYLFLESLLSARQRLIITYTGMSISDNSPIPCAAPVAELMDTVQESFILPGGLEWQVFHPLHAFSPDYFDPDRAGLFSYSAAQCRIAVSQQENKIFHGPDKQFIVPGQAPVPPEEGELPVQVEVSRLIEFFRHPVQAFMTRTLGLVFPDPGEEVPDREAFQVTGLDLYRLGSLCMDRPGDNYPLVRAMGRLPLGRKGKMEMDRIAGLARPVQALAEAAIGEERPESVMADIQAGPFRIAGRVGEIYTRGRVAQGFSKLSPARMLTQWIFHLFYSAAGPSQGKPPGTTLILGRGPDDRKPAAACEFAPLEAGAALDHIHALARLFIAGQDRVLPFLPLPSHGLAAVILDQGLDIPALDADWIPGRVEEKIGEAIPDKVLETALEKVRPLWNGGHHVSGECQNRYTALVFRDQDPFADPQALKSSGFLETALAVYTPLLENLAHERT